MNFWPFIGLRSWDSSLFYIISFIIKKGERKMKKRRRERKHPSVRSFSLDRQFRVCSRYLTPSHNERNRTGIGREAVASCLTRECHCERWVSSVLWETGRRYSSDRPNVYATAVSQPPFLTIQTNTKWPNLNSYLSHSGREKK